jgi:AraC family transcriptional regulator of adaptative response/methylated-DNA-[protein]-cysteine methyltransferase
MMPTSPDRPTSFDTDERRWQALLRRDHAADGQFYYSVATTGVYCRPSCAARRAKRENVRFHPTGEQAERAGFRPCKRCRPDDASLAERQQAAVAHACRLIEDADVMPNLATLAKAVGFSPHHFHRMFRRFTGVTPKAYAAAQRARHMRDELAHGAPVTEAIYGAGFNSSGRFYATSTEQLGMTPTAFRKGGTGTTIRFAVGESTLGSVLVAATENGICAVFLDDDSDELTRHLRDRFPKANIVGGDAEFNQWVAQVVGLVEQPALGLDLPLDIRGTAFQVRVWEALRRIPPGSTISYTELAERIGQPTAARAVAGACAANPIAVAIPCHRVVRTDKSLSGYYWGVERKAELLKREQQTGELARGHG